MTPRLCIFLIALLLSTGRGYAQTLRDPTRPQSGNGSAHNADKPATALPPLPQLQMVLIGAERRYVVIDGELLGIGQFYKGLRIEDIQTNTVVLRTAKGLRSLQMAVTPDQ